jgi:hypothetical protein
MIPQSNIVNILQIISIFAATACIAIGTAKLSEACDIDELQLTSPAMKFLMIGNGILISLMFQFHLC